MSNFEDRILLRMRRQYSKDEAVAFISKRLKESETEKGILKSELAELENTLKEEIEKSKLLNQQLVLVKSENDQLEVKIKAVRKKACDFNNEQWMKDRMLSEAKKRADLRSKIKELKKYQNRYRELRMKYNKISDTQETWPSVLDTRDINP